MFEVPFADSLKCLKANFGFEGAKALNEMKNALDSCKVRADREVSNYAAILSKCLAEICFGDGNDASASEV